MLEIDQRGRLKRNGWAAGRVGSPVTELLPAEEELVELWEALRARARGVRAGLFEVTAALSLPDPPIASALASFAAPAGADATAKQMSFSLIGLERDLKALHSDVHLEQGMQDGKLVPVYGLLIRIFNAEQLPAATEAMERIADVVQDTRLGEFLSEVEA